MPIVRSIKKNGADNFKVEEIIKCNSIESLNYWEKYYIGKFNSLYPQGYNIRLGGKNTIHNNIVKEKISRALKGRVKSIETREKISKTLTGRKLSEEDNLKNAISKGAKPFLVYKDDVLIGQWINQSKCARDLGLRCSDIINLQLTGRTQRSKTGFIFTYRDRE